jgi:hypothetical protein
MRLMQDAGMPIPETMESSEAPSPSHRKSGTQRFTAQGKYFRYALRYTKHVSLALIFHGLMAAAGRAGGF